MICYKVNNGLLYRPYGTQQLTGDTVIYLK